MRSLEVLNSHLRAGVRNSPSFVEGIVVDGCTDCMTVLPLTIVWLRQHQRRATRAGGSAVTTATAAITAIAVTAVTVDIDASAGRFRHERAARTVGSSTTNHDKSGNCSYSDEGVLPGTAAIGQE